jgi:hypothetical protein
MTTPSSHKKGDAIKLHFREERPYLMEIRFVDREAPCWVGGENPKVLLEFARVYDPKNIKRLIIFNPKEEGE